MTTDTKRKFDRWLATAELEKELRLELESIQSNTAAIEDRFYKDLEFGTGGLRGLIGAGSNRMNVYTVARATQGLANHINANSNSNKSVAIAFDSRIHSDVFAQKAASVLAANGITAWIYPRLEPTPALSWAVRYLHCDGGICITASHNPSEYNGYKVYNADGCQITVTDATAIQTSIDGVDILNGVKQMDFTEGLTAGKIKIIPESVLNDYIDAVHMQRLLPDQKSSLKIVYTPLNGAGRECVLRILKQMGITNVLTVPEQEWPDGLFSTCPYPNPEIPEALQKGLELCQTVQPDLLIATDPDCDRAGIAVKQGARYCLMSGNEVGVLLLDYICKVRIANKTMPSNPIVISTIVSTDMAEAVGAKYDVELRRTLTGFKFIGEQIGALERNGEAQRYIFGFEESYGYLSGSYVRDKDAVNAAMLICEMTQYYKEKGKTLVDVMNALYAEFGFYYNRLYTFSFEDSHGLDKICMIMDGLRENTPVKIGGFAVECVTDYMQGINELPHANVLGFVLAGGNKLLVRPSGTEPKIKFYISTKGLDIQACKKADGQIRMGIEKMVNQ